MTPSHRLGRAAAVVAALGVAVAAVVPAAAPVAAAPTRAAGAIVPAPSAVTTAAVPTSFTFRGSGWGHGLGMSQYGAYGQALEGRTATQILEHYYNPAKVASDSMNPTIRVQVLSTSAVTISGPAGKWAIEIGPGQWQQIAAGSITAEFRNADGQDRVYVGSWRTNSSAMPELNLRWSEGGVVVPGADAGTKSVEYRRGTLALGPRNGRVNVVSSLPLNQYLYGLAEMPSSWPAPALEAQAIAGRTYALRAYAAGIKSATNAHLTDETTSQKYTAWNKESEGTAAVWGNRWKAAVDAIASSTGGKSVKYGTQLAQTYYSSSTGGRTVNSEDVWGGASIPYLRSQDDHWSQLASVKNSKASWVVTKSQTEIASLFGLPDVKRLSVTKVSGNSGAVMQVRATSSAGVTRDLTDGTSTDDVRTELKLDSAYFTIDGNLEVERLGGADRYGTAIAIGKAAFPTSTEVVLVSAQQVSLVDGLVAAPFARKHAAPVLLAERDSIPAPSLAEIDRRAITTAWLIGGEGVLGPKVVAALESRGITVNRLAGVDRYATAAAVAREMGPSSEALIASGANRSLIDAAAAGGPAAALGLPVVLAAPGELPSVTARTLEDLGVTHGVIIGGTGAVGPDVEAGLAAIGLTTERVGGVDRYSTAAAVATHFAADVDVSTVLVASGADLSLIDSVTGGVLGHLTLLTSPTSTTAVTSAWIAARPVTKLQIAGGTGVVPDRVVNGLG